MSINNDTEESNDVSNTMELDEFIDFEYDDVTDRPGRLIVALDLLASETVLIRHILQNVVIMSAEFDQMSQCMMYKGYSPLFRRSAVITDYQAWVDKKNGRVDIHPDPEQLWGITN